MKSSKCPCCGSVFIKQSSSHRFCQKTCTKKWKQLVIKCGYFMGEGKSMKHIMLLLNVPSYTVGVLMDDVNQKNQTNGIVEVYDWPIHPKRQPEPLKYGIKPEWRLPMMFTPEEENFDRDAYLKLVGIKKNHLTL